MRDVSLTVLELDGPVPSWIWGSALSAEHSESMSDRETRNTRDGSEAGFYGAHVVCDFADFGNAYNITACDSAQLYADLEIRTTLRYVTAPIIGVSDQ